MCLNHRFCLTGSTRASAINVLMMSDCGWLVLLMTSNSSRGRKWRQNAQIYLGYLSDNLTFDTLVQSFIAPIEAPNECGLIDWLFDWSFDWLCDVSDGLFGESSADRSDNWLVFCPIDGSDHLFINLAVRQIDCLIATSCCTPSTAGGTTIISAKQLGPDFLLCQSKIQWYVRFYTGCHQTLHFVKNDQYRDCEASS